MELAPAILEKGTELLLKQLEELIAQNSDLGTIHNAFQAYCTNRYSLGSSASTVESGGKNDLGVDFYSWRDRNYVVGQCKVPAQDYLEANPSVPRLFGPNVVNDPRDALQYLLGESAAKANDRIRALYAHIQADRNSDDFLLTFYLLVYGRLAPGARPPRRVRMEVGRMMAAVVRSLRRTHPYRRIGLFNTFAQTISEPECFRLSRRSECANQHGGLFDAGVVTSL